MLAALAQLPNEFGLAPYPSGIFRARRHTYEIGDEGLLVYVEKRHGRNEPLEENRFDVDVAEGVE